MSDAAQAWEAEITRRLDELERRQTLRVPITRQERDAATARRREDRPPQQLDLSR